MRRLSRSKTSVDPAVLISVAAKSSPETPLSQAESDAYARFDLIVTALLDEAYQLSDQVYRNSTRALAAVVAVALAFVGGWSLVGTAQFWHSSDPVLALLVGLLATPLAPIAKDLVQRPGDGRQYHATGEEVGCHDAISSTFACNRSAADWPPRPLCIRAPASATTRSCA